VLARTVTVGMVSSKEFLSRRVVASLTAEHRSVVWDTKIDGFGLRISPNGTKTFVFAYRFPRGRAGKMRWYTLGKADDLSPEDARAQAAIMRGDYLRGIDPMARRDELRQQQLAELAVSKTAVRHVVEEFVTRHAKKNNRSWKETERILKRHFVAQFGDRPIQSITRAEINDLLDHVEDESGAPMATAVLAQVRKLCNWYAARDGDFNSPIVKGMARTNPKKLARDRVLSDPEIRIMWRALDASPAPFRQLVRFLLLTAQRRDEASQARRSELRTDVWIIPAERYKTGIPHAVPLTAAARRQIEDLGEFLQLGPYAFTTTGNRPFSGFSKAKRRLDAEMERLLQEELGPPVRPKTAHLVPWRLHDLRRTAKTLMVRAGVRPDISERVLGHVIAGVEGTYDRHDYLDERRDALEKLALAIEELIHQKAGQSEGVRQYSVRKGVSFP